MSMVATFCKARNCIIVKHGFYLLRQGEKLELVEKLVAVPDPCKNAHIKAKLALKRALCIRVKFTLDQNAVTCPAISSYDVIGSGRKRYCILKFQNCRPVIVTGSWFREQGMIAVSI